MAGLAWLTAMWSNAIQQTVWGKISTQQSMSARDTKMFLARLRKCDQMIEEDADHKKKKTGRPKTLEVCFPATWKCKFCETTNHDSSNICINTGCSKGRPNVAIEHEIDPIDQLPAKEETNGCFKCLCRRNKRSDIKQEHRKLMEDTSDYSYHVEENKQSLEQVEMGQIRRMTRS